MLDMSGKSYERTLCVRLLTGASRHREGVLALRRGLCPASPGSGCRIKMQPIR
jgi:hypothetical protein